MCHVGTVVSGLAPRKEVPDLVAEAACALVARSTLEPPIENWTAYATRVVRNICKAWLRAAYGSPEVPTPWFEFESKDARAGRIPRIHGKRGRRLPPGCLLALAKVLEPREQKVLVLHFRRKKAVKKIARELGLSPFQVRRSIQRILESARDVCGQPAD